jgi:hypothetical protein
VKFLKVALAALASFFALAGVVSPAAAAEPYRFGPQGVAATESPVGLILGEHQYLAGKQFYVTYSLSELVNYNDKASSVWNNTSDQYYILFDDRNFLGGNNYCLRPYDYIEDLHDYGFGDKVSSVKRLSDVEARTGCSGYRTFF